MSKKFTLGFSPCPNDTFIFDAIVNKKIDTQGIDFEIIMEDVEQLNNKAWAKTLDITKLSYFAVGHLLPHYQILLAGSALGTGCGPLLISKHSMPLTNVPQCRIGIPGKHTTANFLLSLAFPTAQRKKEMFFFEIEPNLLNNNIDAGVIIHENRFTYHQKGLVKLLDLGDFWEKTTQLPIPLGCIAIKRSIDAETKLLVNNILQKSIAYAFENKNSTLPFVRQHAQEMDEEVMLQHIDLYVNNYTLNLGEQGKKAVLTLFEKATEKELISANNANFEIFVA